MNNLFTIAMTAAIVGGFVFGVFFALPDSSRSESSLPAKVLKRTEVEISGEPLEVEIADTQGARLQGLSGREELPKNTGLLLVFDADDRHGIWMKGMRFPLDLFWIRGGRVVHIEENVPPAPPGASDFALPLYNSPDPARMVLEAAAGFAAQYGIRVGDRVRTGVEEKREETFSPPPNGSRADSPRAPLPGAEDFPGFEFTIEALRRRLPQGGNFRLGDLLAETRAYKKHAIIYASGDLTISGVMNVPKENPPPGGFPVLVLNHGLIHPSVYVSGRGSKREQDFFARNGYVTIHPDYRGLASSDPDPASRHDFYVGYSKDVVNLVDAVFKADLDFIDERRIGVWGHSMGGGIAARVMTLEPRVRAYVLFAPISADAEENFYELPQNEVAWLRKTYGEEGAAVYRLISPLAYFGDAAAPVQIHHGTADKDVPIRFSETMFDTLREQGKIAEFFRYPGEPHEFVKDWPLAAERALQFFDLYVKNGD